MTVTLKSPTTSSAVQSALLLWLPVLFAALGAVLVLVAAAQGIGTSPDSVAYIGTARNLLDGRGLTLPYGSPQDTPLALFPPFYPILLAIGGLFTGDPLSAAPALNALLFAALILLAAWVVRRLAPQSRLLAPAVALLLAVSPAMVDLHRMAWSEPLYMVLSLGSIAAVSIAIQHASQRSLWVSAALLALAILTRFVGLALLPLAVIAILAAFPVSLRRRVALAVGYSLVSLLPLVVWFGSLLTAGTGSGRNFAFHLPQKHLIYQIAGALGGWFLLPQGWPAWAQVIPAGLVGLAVLFGLWKMFRAQKLDLLTRMLASYIVVYMLFIVATITFVDAHNSINARTLAPLFPVALGLLAAVIHFAPRRLARPLAIILLLFALVSFQQAVAFTRSASAVTFGFRGPHWQDAALQAELAALPANTLIYTNSPEGIYLAYDRRAVTLPKPFSPMTLSADPQFKPQMDALRQALIRRQAVIIYFPAIQSTAILPAAELEESLPVQASAHTATATIYVTAP